MLYEYFIPFNDVFISSYSFKMFWELIGLLSNYHNRLFVNERQDDWDKLLPLAEFQYNNHVHSATQQTPFMLDTGRHLWMGFEPHQAESQLETVNEFWDRMDSMLSEARSALRKVKEDMAQYHNQRQVLAPEYHIRDKVY